jgi:hypothetical protein
MLVYMKIKSINMIYFSLQRQLKNVVFDLMLLLNNVYHRRFLHVGLVILKTQWNRDFNVFFL